jgi:uncharacterized protein YbjT (DUF2867 family)
VHISALGADDNAPSEYLRSKAAGEVAIRAAGDQPAWTILRPSVIFGRGDRFLNLFADLVRYFPVLPLAGATARFQPVYVEDVVEVVCRCLTDRTTIGQTFELTGPSVYTLRELVEYVSEVLGKRRLVVPLSARLGMIQAAVMERLPGPLMTRDNLRSMQVDNVASGVALPLGLTPTALETVVPSWLTNQGSRGHYYKSRTRARRG